MTPMHFPASLEGHGIRLELLHAGHELGLRVAAADGELWQITYTSVPEPENTAAYIAEALRDCERKARWPFAVRDLGSNRIIGSTSYHDIMLDVRRVEIGYTWYGRSWQRTHVNTVCKWLLLRHAFEAMGCPVVGWRTDIVNLRSQAAIERLGARRDGVIRRNRLRRDGTIRDTVMYSMTAEEWTASVRDRLRGKLPVSP